MRTNDTTHQAKNVLVVGNSPTQAAKLQRILETDGWEVGVARDGREALDLIEKHPPDIVLSDAEVPEMDGHTLCAEVKKRTDLKDVPFVLITKLDDPTDFVRGLQCGANSFIVKPYDENHLLSRVRDVAANAELQRTTRSEIGIEIRLAGQMHLLTPERLQVLAPLLSSFQAAADKTRALEQQMAELARALHSVQILEESYRALLDRYGDGILVVDDQGAVCFANPAARDLLGPGGTGTQDLLSCVPIGFDGVLETEIARDSVPSATVEVRATNVEWQGLCARLVTLHDVTARKLAVEQLERTRQEQLSVKDGFLSQVSHELRTPLAAINEFVTILLDGLAGPISDEQRDYLGIAHRNAGQLRDMIEDLLQANCAQSGKVTVEPCELSLLPVLSGVEATLRQTATAKGLTLKLEAAPGLPTLYADPQRVRQIVLNLMDNAIKFTPAGGTITVAAALQPGNDAFVQISVRDTGCGISAEDCEHIFEQLYQVERRRNENRKGLGLGLFIARDLVSRQDGRIWVESKLGRGTTFHVTLPLFTPEQILGHAIQRRQAQAGREQGKLCVLLLTLDADAISKATSVERGMKGVTLNDVSEALARKVKELAFHEMAFSGSEFIVLTEVPDDARMAVQEKLRRLLKDLLFETVPAAVAGFSCGVATRTAEVAGAAELLRAARNALVHERERIVGKHIVVVDDEQSQRKMLKEAISRLGVRRIGEASGGNELLAMLQEEVPDLIILDLRMPGMSGYEVIGRLKEHRRTADIPILVVSGYQVKSEELPKGSPKAAVLVLAKPVEVEALRSYVSYLL